MITETAGIVVAHLELVVGIVFIGQSHALDGVVGVVELAEDGDEFVGNQPVADQLALVGLLIVIPMEYPDIAEVIALDMGIFYIRFPLHLLPDGIGYLGGYKSILSEQTGYFDGED